MVRGGTYRLSTMAGEGVRRVPVGSHKGGVIAQLGSSLGEEKRELYYYRRFGGGQERE